MNNKSQQGSRLSVHIKVLFGIIACGSSVCLASPSDSQDPYEKFNRPMFAFNEKLDKYFLKPVATLYNAIMPRPLNEGIHNAFKNLGELPTIANDILQLHFYQMANDSWRFLINSTVGIGGLFDVATRINLPYYANDFGLTLATWGYENSNYLVLPFWGPGTIRDAIGIPVDYYGFSIYPYIEPDSVQWGVYGLSIIDRRANILQYQPIFEEAAINRYAFLRSAYMQRRHSQIEANQNLGVGVRYRANAGSNNTDNNNNNAAGVTSEQQKS